METVSLKTYYSVTTMNRKCTVCLAPLTGSMGFRGLMASN